MNELLEQKAKLLGSLLLFTQVFYKLRTGREFELSQPLSRESHYITICKALKRVFNGECKRLIINVPPRYGKTELVIHFIAWCLARYADSNFLYISYAHTLAKKQTQTIKQILEMPHYRKLFGVEISGDTSAKDNFETTLFGSVYAAGAGGSITGRGAGLKNVQRFGGAIVIDDIHKPAEVTSDTIRESINDWYFNTLLSRTNSPETPIIFIGQRLHEDDLAANLLKSGDWETVILPALDKLNNALHPQMHDVAALMKMEQESPYVFSAQYQQNPQPAGGGIFKPEWFVLLDEEPEIVATFITADTAETSKDYNDASVFSFWGLYRIKEQNVDVDLWGLHWIDCYEFRVEPKDLEPEFRQFFAGCLRYKVQPKLAAIEKKSTGATLLSVLGALRGLQLVDIERTKATGSKATRYLEAQPFLASKRISLPKYGKHTDMCLEHMRKITANDTHRFDDIADTFYDAVKIGLIDDFISRSVVAKDEHSAVVKQLNAAMRHTKRLRENAYA
jgi:hypothetical protein